MIRGFMPLGVFLRRTICESQACSLEQALGYVKRLRLEHVYIEPFVAHGLGETKPPRGEGTNAKKGRAEELPQTKEMGQVRRSRETAWVKTSVGQVRISR